MTHILAKTNFRDFFCLISQQFLEIFGFFSFFLVRHIVCIKRLDSITPESVFILYPKNVGQNMFANKEINVENKLGL